MNFDILPTRKFEKELKRLVKKYPSLKTKYARLIQEIINKPETGTPLGLIVIKYV